MQVIRQDKKHFKASLDKRYREISSNEILSDF